MSLAPTTDPAAADAGPATLLAQARPALVLTVLFTLLLGLAYPLAVTGLAQALFPDEANGSLVVRGGVRVGSALIGQAFADPGHLHGRPSAAGTGYDGLASSGSNLAPTSKALAARIAAGVAALRAEGAAGPIPADAVTASASGLDPDVSPAFAALQVPRIAKARGMSEDAVRAIVAANTAWPLFGVVGEPRVDVLAVNLALDAGS